MLPMASPSISSLLNTNSPQLGSNPEDYFSQAPDSLELNPPEDKPSPPAPPPRKRQRSPSAIPSPSLPPPALRPSPTASVPKPLPDNPPQPQRGATLEPSLFLVEPIDEFTREVADWLWAFAGGLDWNVVEIEAKIGVLLDTRTPRRERVHLPVPIETILTDDTGLRFESNMTINQHKAFNKLLNSRVEESASPAYPYSPVRYAHTRERDAFHIDPATRKKVRVTTDQADGRELRVVAKDRVADMNVFSPKRGFDWRVSVNVEVPSRSPPAHSQATNTRNKDRISYSHQLFQVDLTQVTTSGGAGGRDGPVSHELEIEFKDAKVLLVEGQKEQRGEENQYLEMVQCFLNNIRMLIRNAADP